MVALTFYRQKRSDGGIRSGIEVNDNTVLARFQAGKGDPPDPGLLWYVDVRCKGPKLPRMAEQSRQWFLDHGPLIQRELRDLADQFTAGMDADIWPIQHEVHGTPRGTKITIVCSAMRRLTGHNVAKVFRDLADHWPERVAELTSRD